jgi:hypothetical protein
MTISEAGIRAASQELIEELMGAVVAVDFVLQMGDHTAREGHRPDGRRHPGRCGLGRGGRAAALLRPLKDERE